MQKTKSESMRIFRFMFKLQMIHLKVRLNAYYFKAKLSLEYSFIGLLFSDIKENFTLPKLFKFSFFLAGGALLNLLVLDAVLYLCY